MSPFVKPPTGKSFRFVRACERARRGEAVWASERRFDRAARAVGEANGLQCSGQTVPVVRGQLLSESNEKHMAFQHFSRTTRGQPCKTNGFPTLFADNLVKPM